MALEQKSIKHIKRRNQMLIERSRVGGYQHPTFVREIVIDLVEINRLLISKVEKLEEEIATLKGETVSTEN